MGTPSTLTEATCTPSGNLLTIPPRPLMGTKSVCSGRTGPHYPREFQRLMEMAADDSEVSSDLVMVNGAKGGVDTSKWNDPNYKHFRTGRNAWQLILERDLTRARVTPFGRLLIARGSLFCPSRTASSSRSYGGYSPSPSLSQPIIMVGLDGNSKPSRTQ